MSRIGGPLYPPPNKKTGVIRVNGGIEKGSEP